MEEINEGDSIVEQIDKKNMANVPRETLENIVLYYHNEVPKLKAEIMKLQMTLANERLAAADVKA